MPTSDRWKEASKDSQACGVCRRALEAVEGLAPEDRAFFRRALLPSRPGGGIKQAAAESCPTWNRFAGGAIAKVPRESCSAAHFTSYLKRPRHHLTRTFV